MSERVRFVSVSASLGDIYAVDTEGRLWWCENEAWGEWKLVNSPPDPDTEKRTDVSVRGQERTS